MLPVGLVIAYIAVIIGFHQVDLYHKHFFDHGALVFFYQLQRIFFLFALAWLVYVVGAIVTRAVCGSGFFWSLAAYERYPLGFFVGSGIWHVVLFCAGLAGLYIWPVVAIMTVAVAAISIPHMSRCLREARSSFCRVRFPNNVGDGVLAVLWIGLLFVSATFVAVRGLYPLGGHDYYLHYFSYLTEVVRSGSLRPNAVWYHFYDSKGLSLTFLGMLLTDPEAPSLVTTVFAGFGACVVYAILRHATASRVLAMCGAVLYVLFFAVGNDELEKQHVTTAVLSLAMLWASIRLLDVDANRRAWTMVLASSAVTMVLITVELGLLIVMYLGGFVIWFWWRREWRRAAAPLVVALIAGVGVIAMLGLNYAYTGLPLEHLVLAAWRYADLNRLRDWGVLYEVLSLHYAFTGLASTVNHSTSLFTPAQLWSSAFAQALAGYFRLPIWWPLLVPIVLLVPFRLRDRAARQLLSPRYLAAVAALGWFSICILAVAIMIGTAEIFSFTRLMSLAYPVTLCLILLGWHFALHPLPQARPFPQVVGLVIGCVTLVLLWPLASYSTARPELAWRMEYRGEHGVGLNTILTNGWRFLTGSFSLKDANQNQVGWEAKHPTGGIWPGLEVPWKIVGPNTPIVAFHIHAYCMLPDCNVVVPITFRLGKHWKTPYLMYLGSADQAEAQLRADGINYFFVSKDLPVYSFFQGILPALAPEIRKRLGIRWTDGRNYLLTWRGKDTTPIDDEFMKFYAKTVHLGVESPCEKGMPGAQCPVYHHLLRHEADLRPFALPWCLNCAGLLPVDK